MVLNKYLLEKYAQGFWFANTIPDTINFYDLFSQVMLEIIKMFWLWQTQE